MIAVALFDDASTGQEHALRNCGIAAAVGACFRPCSVLSPFGFPCLVASQPMPFCLLLRRLPLSVLQCRVAVARGIGFRATSLAFPCLFQFGSPSGSGSMCDVYAQPGSGERKAEPAAASPSSGSRRVRPICLCSLSNGLSVLIWSALTWRRRSLRIRQVLEEILLPLLLSHPSAALRRNVARVSVRSSFRPVVR
jgi:hypothetical protein